MIERSIDSLVYRVPVVAFALLDFFLQSFSKAGFVCGFAAIGDFALIQAHRSVANGAQDGGEAFFPHIWHAWHDAPSVRLPQQPNSQVDNGVPAKNEVIRANTCDVRHATA